MKYKIIPPPTQPNPRGLHPLEPHCHNPNLNSNHPPTLPQKAAPPGTPMPQPLKKNNDF